MVPEALVERLARTLAPGTGAPALVDAAAARACLEELAPALAGAPAALRALWAAAGAERELARATVELLAALGDPAGVAMRALVQAYDDGSFARSSWGHVANIETVVEAEPGTAFDRLRPYCSGDALASDAGGALAGQLLGSVRLLPVCERDGRWRELAEACLRHPALAVDAEQYLARAAKGAPVPAAPPLAPALAAVAARVGAAPSSALAPGAATTALRKGAFVARRVLGLTARIWSAAAGDAALVGAARRVLAELGHDAARAAAWLDAALARAAEAPGAALAPEFATEAGRAARALVALDPDSAFGRLGHLFPPAGQGAAATAALEALRAVEPPLFAADPRWAEAAARCLATPLTRGEARAILVRLGSAALATALERAGVLRRPVPRRAKQPLPARRDFLARYEAGEHEAVWAELVALGGTVRDPALAAEAAGVARAVMARVRQNLELVTARLRKHGYDLRAGKKALGKGGDAAKLVAACEKAAGGALPLSLVAFWQVCGSVDLRAGDGAVPATSPFEGLGEEDPLVVCAPKEALEDLKVVARENKGLPAGLQDPVAFMLAPGRDAKTDPAGGDDRPLRLALPDEAADGTLFFAAGGPEELFVPYLRRALARGGFVALDAAEHGPAWPGLGILTAGLLPF